MKILLDSCVWGLAAQALDKLGYDVVWAGSWEKDPGDDEILSRAHREGRVLVTLDKDFGELSVVFRKPHGGIIRLVGIPSRQQAMTTHRMMMRFGTALKCGALVTVDSFKVRFREPETWPPASGGKGVEQTPGIEESPVTYRIGKHKTKTGRRKPPKIRK